MLLSGLNNVFESEAIPGALPRDQNNPQQSPLGLYTEQLSGTSFTRPRAHNRFIWLYRALPACAYNDGFVPLQTACGRDAETMRVDPNPGRWGPVPEPDEGKLVDFVDGLRMFGQSGNSSTGEGLAIYWYSANKSMEARSVSFHDGEILLVPQRGSLKIRTEMGELEVHPLQICVIPRGVKWTMTLLPGVEGSLSHRGYMVEVFNEGGFRLPDLGPIGANGLANPVHFEHPTASIDVAKYSTWENVIKVGGKWFHQTGLQHSPFDVVAWRGNLLPYRYDLRKFCAMSTVTFDHPDPSIFTVLTVPTSVPGVAACDFVIFPPRWMVATKTFRPPYFHRNVMTEFMGLIEGKYDGKVGGFVPGGASLHSRLVPHGPDAATFNHASNAELAPTFYDAGLAFMFETVYLLETTEFARKGPHREKDYAQCWKPLKRAAL